MSKARGVIFRCLLMAHVPISVWAQSNHDVDVVTVSETNAETAFVSKIAEALVAEPLAVHWGTRPEFNTDAFLAVGTPSRPTAWIDVRDRSAISVYFRDADAQRFFVRRFPAQSNDDILAEHVAQVIAPTLSALADHTQPALTGEQIRTELALAQSPSPAQPAPSPTVQMLAWQNARPPTKRALAVESVYVVQWISTHGAAAQGPRLRLSSRWNNALGDVTVWTSVWKPIGLAPQGLMGEDWHMNLWDWRLGLAFSVAQTKDIGFAVGLGGGADWISAGPNAASNADTSAILPALRWELRTELRIVDWLYGTVGASIDLLPPTLLQHQATDGAHRSMELATWQPAAWLGLEVRGAEF